MSIKQELGLDCGGACTGACCKVMFLPIADLDRLRWAALHGYRIFRIRETGEFRMLIEKRCAQLDGKDRCAIYEKRPEMCRTYECSKAPTYEEYEFENDVPVPKI